MVPVVVVLLMGGLLLYSGLHDMTVTDSLRTLLGRSPSGGGLGSFIKGAGSGGVPTGSTSGSFSGMIQAANQINAAQYPYVWGGGHAQAGTPSGNPPGYDCSGCTAAVLWGGGFWSGSVPTDAGIITELLKKGIISGGSASGSNGVTIYDMPGDHIFLGFIINGEKRYFGTSDGNGGPNNTSRFGKGGGGGTWLTYGPDVSTFTRFHIKPELLT